MVEKRYNKARIYKIVCNITGKIYIGSTCKALSARLAQHRADYKKNLQGKYGNLTSFIILKEGDYKIVLLENYPCGSKEDLLKRERYYIDENECVNKNVPLRTAKEQKDKYHQYYLDNREKILEKMKIRHITKPPSEIITCACGATHIKKGTNRHCKTLKHQNYLALL
jgi:hypothetical protein